MSDPSLKLNSDPEDEIRDWAVFGLGVTGDADSPEIREEAAVGLGKRRDRCMIPALLKLLEDADFEVRAAIAKIGE